METYTYLCLYMSYACTYFEFNAYQSVRSNQTVIYTQMHNIPGYLYADAQIIHACFHRTYVS